MRNEDRAPPVHPDKVQEIAAQARMGRTYLVLMAAAGVLAAVALLTNSVPILIGAMVVGPVFGPLALIAFALLGRQPRLALRGLGASLVGLALTVAFAVLTTWVMNITNVLPAEANLLDKPLLEERVRPGWYSVAAAIAGGAAGAVALAQGKVDTLVGVVASVALVPAAAASGIALLSRDPTRSLGGLQLLGINMALIVLTSVVTLLVLRPQQEDRG